MRRILTAMAPTVAIALALAAPGAAFGHGARRHHRHHHARGARVIKLAPAQGGKEAAEPGSLAGESVGTVSSYEKEVLTIKLTDGSLLSGKVTTQTRVICVAPAPTTGTGDGSGNNGHAGWWHRSDSCYGPPSDEGAPTPAGESSPGPAWHGDRSGAGARGDCFQGKEVDLEKVLVAGATVDEAELRLTPAGAVWDSVVIGQ